MRTCTIFGLHGSEIACLVKDQDELGLTNKIMDRKGGYQGIREIDEESDFKLRYHDEGIEIFTSPYAVYS